MTYQRERDEFIVRMTNEGLNYDTILQLLRESTGINRRAELACSSEAADRDRVPCPHTANPKRPCLCDGDHDPGRRVIPRIALQDWYAEERIRRTLAAVNGGTWAFSTAGDPRGCVLKVIPPSYAERNANRPTHDRDGVCVPSGPSGIRW